MRSAFPSTRRVWLLVNVVLTLALLPALFTEPEGEAVVVAASAGTFQTVPVAANAASSSTTSTTAAPPPPSTTTTSTTAAPAPTTTAAPKPKAAAAPKPAPTTTTTAAPKPAPKPTTTTTTAPPAPPSSGRTESGKASWYDYRPGTCAHKTLPMGTVVTVTASNGKSTRCTVADRGPFVEGWIIDLHPQEFEQLAPRSAGVISVTISW